MAVQVKAALKAAKIAAHVRAAFFDNDSPERKALIAVVAALIAVLLVLCLPIFVVMSFTISQAQAAGNLYGNEAIVAQRLLDEGYSPLHAAAIMGNIYKESRFDSGAVEAEPNNMGTRGFGLLQWTDPPGGMCRRTDLTLFAASQGVHISDINMQLDFLIGEMKQEGPAVNYSSDRWGAWYACPERPRSRGTHDGFLATTSLDGDSNLTNAVLYFGRYFVRPAEGGADWDERMSRAEHYYGLLTTGGFGGDFSGSLLWPVPGFNRVTSGFGWRTCPIRGTQSFHGGIDIAGPGIYGASVVAAADGRVVFAAWRGGFGNTIVIYHGDGVQTLYAHLRNGGINVSNGQLVTAGQHIGQVGSTGFSTGPHLHWEVIVNGQQVDPMSF